jgi:threonine dehydratase
MITSSDVRAAADRIAGQVRVTPLIEADQRSFPPAASGGNAGLAVAYAAARHGLPARAHPARRVAVVVCGANTDPATLA